MGHAQRKMIINVGLKKDHFGNYGIRKQWDRHHNQVSTSINKRYSKFKKSGFHLKIKYYIYQSSSVSSFIFVSQMHDSSKNRS